MNPLGNVEESAYGFPRTVGVPGIFADTSGK